MLLQTSQMLSPPQMPLPPPLPPHFGSNATFQDDEKRRRCSNQQGGKGDTAGLYSFYLCLNDTRFVKIFHKFEEDIERGRVRELPMLAVIIGVYSLFILSGGFGNGLVMVSVCRNRHMRTARNLFILNLAISDFILCFVTQPLNILRLFPRYISWEFGVTLCKVVNTLTGVNMFVSAFSITAIALDRFQVIVYPTRNRMENKTMALCLVSIWGAACMMASPLALFANTLVTDIRGRQMCSEVTKGIFVLYAKLAYSLGIMLVQYLVPLGIVSAAYARICLRLQDRMRSMKQRQLNVSSYQAKRQAQEAARRRRANILLVTISVVFGMSWLPLTVVNIIHDFRLLRVQKDSESDQDGGNSHLAIAVSQSIPLLLVLVSACLNPVLYGWFNDNFQTEFHRLLCQNRLARAGPKFKARATSSGASGAAAAAAAAAGAGAGDAAIEGEAASVNAQPVAATIPLIVLNQPEFIQDVGGNQDDSDDSNEINEQLPAGVDEDSIA